ncbi:MAG: cyclic nucleotide-binding domain-containing protein [Ilumatobacteraceae bacterium]
MTCDAESPTTASTPAGVTGGAALTRSWYTTARSVLGKPRVELMSHDRDPTTISHPSQPISSLLGTIPSLRFATPTGLRRLADATSREAVAGGEAIVRQGEYGDDVFFIVDGAYDVLISHFGHAPDFIRILGSGDSFGELGVLYDVPRTATVRCTSAGNVLRIPGKTFLDALDTGA